MIQCSYPKGRVPSSVSARRIVHHEGASLTVIACGTMVILTLAGGARLCARTAARRFHRHARRSSRSIMKIGAPRGSQRTKRLLTVEEHNVPSAASAAQLRKSWRDIGGAPRLVRHGIMDEYSPIAPPTHLYAHYRLDASGIEAVAHESRWR